MNMKADLDKLMQEAQKMQEKMQAAQKELNAVTVVGEAGAGLVKVEMNGRHDVTKVTIKETLMNDDKEMIEDLVAAAVNDAVRKVEKVSKDKISQLTAGLNIPGSFAGGEDQA